MTNRSHIFGLFIFGLFVSSSLYQSGIDIQVNEAEISFPETILFSLEAVAEKEIVAVEIVYGTDAISCGDPLTRAKPDDFTPGKSVEVTWEMVMRRTLSLPPGAQVWWYWRLEDLDGNQFETPKQTLDFIDDTYSWRMKESDNIEIYWYQGSEIFAENLLKVGEDTLDYLAEITGVRLDGKISIYIYESSDEMRESTLFAPDWSGGLAYTDHRTVIAGVPPESVSWGNEVISHEVTHVLVEYYTFSCVSGLPTWLEEGLATFAEGGVGVSHEYEEQLVLKAIESDSLFTVKRLGELFSNDPDLARQSYAQSYSLVEYLITTYGQEKMLALLSAFKEGASQDSALRAAYDLDQETLDAEWREWLGVPEREDAESRAVTPTRTVFPTFAPIVGGTDVPATTLEPPTEIPPTLAQTPTPEKDDFPEDKNGAKGWLIYGFSGLSLLAILFLIRNIRKQSKLNGG